MIQIPMPGARLLLVKGDCLTFRLELDQPCDGEAFLRTNLGRGGVRRREVIDFTEKRKPVLHTDWHDLPMTRVDDRVHTVTLPLVEVGCFEAKAWFQPVGDGKSLWAPGKDNTKIKVEPAGTACANSIYTLFPRQFGPQRFSRSRKTDNDENVKLLDEQGYAVIPPSGTYREVIKELDFIIGRLRCRIIQLLPVHPVPTTYGRMGRFGSPFAALDFFAVDPACAEFDPKATPLEQFAELVDAIHARQAKVFIDIPVNHTGWASRLQYEHPEWFERLPDRTIVSPGAWGVVWADLCKLNYKRDEVHHFMAEVFLYWCRRGIDGFRCDAGYMIPFEAWEYIVAKVRTEYPDTIFMLEGLGGPLAVTARLLGEAGLNWAYSELFQNYDRSQIGYYLPGCIDNSMKNGIHVHFAETHDNTRLAAKSADYARLRTALCSMFAHNGAFGITNGVEWFADARVLVHGAEPLNWGNHDNQVELLRRLHAIMEVHPVFHAGAVLELIQNGNENALAMLRTSADGRHKTLVVVNLSDDGSSAAHWPADRFVSHHGYWDLVGARRVEVYTHDGRSGCHLAPGQVMCISAQNSDFDLIDAVMNGPLQQPERLLRQEFRAMALEAICSQRGYGDCSAVDIDRWAEMLRTDPVGAVTELCSCDLPPLTTWTAGTDERRRVMIPPGDMLLFRSEHPFRFEIKDGDTTCHGGCSLPFRDGGHAFLLSSLRGEGKRILNFTSFSAGMPAVTSQAFLLLLPAEPPTAFRCEYSGSEALDADLSAICSNRLGGMAQVRAAWGEIGSKYDAILAANCHHDYPVDRTVMLTRCRAWLVYRDYSQEIGRCCLDRFRAGADNVVQWDFSVPAGQGKTASLRVTLSFDENENLVRLSFHRLTGAEDGETALDDAQPVRLIIRPDLEDRSNHEVTKAFLGAEHTFRRVTTSDSAGFYFNPSHDHALAMRVDRGRFVGEPEWQYMVGLPVEIQRGLDGHSDLYSPGYFEFYLRGGENRTLTAEVFSGREVGRTAVAETAPGPLPAERPLMAALASAVSRFVVKRDDSRTVIAGYPWFLDWGRDTLICLRGMIAAGLLEESRDIIRVFARFEKKGTLPNMIRGNDDSNRDTSDAPLWMMVAIHDYIRAAGDASVLSMDCGGRSLLEVMVSIASHYRDGTPNGIVTDPLSGLVFSPSHFTWMDTNHPAGTPREGYPIEIQALWYAALTFLHEYDQIGGWGALAEKVRKSIETLYPLPQGFLSDCLHGSRGQAAAGAMRDDALRPNQLFAVTLGAVTDRRLTLGIIRACESLLIPGAIRSLADREVGFPQPVFRNGVLLNDPQRPYWGGYAGDEDTRRKPAYHNGTAWTWPFPAYCEALMMVGGDGQRRRAMSLLLSARELVDTGCVGQIPEIADGNDPHTWRGCGAQAWGVTELLRVYCRGNRELTHY